MGYHASGDSDNSDMMMRQMQVTNSFNDMIYKILHPQFEDMLLEKGLCRIAVHIVVGILVVTAPRGGEGAGEHAPPKGWGRGF